MKDFIKTILFFTFINSNFILGSFLINHNKESQKHDKVNFLELIKKHNKKLIGSVGTCAFAFILYKTNNNFKKQLNKFLNFANNKTDSILNKLHIPNFKHRKPIFGLGLFSCIFFSKFFTHKKDNLNQDDKNSKGASELTNSNNQNQNQNQQQQQDNTRQNNNKTLLIDPEITQEKINNQVNKNQEISGISQVSVKIEETSEILNSNQQSQITNNPIIIQNQQKTNQYQDLNEQQKQDYEKNSKGKEESRIINQNKQQNVNFSTNFKQQQQQQINGGNVEEGEEGTTLTIHYKKK